MILSWYRALALLVTAAGLLIVTAAQEPKQHPATDMSLTTPERL